MKIFLGIIFVALTMICCKKEVIEGPQGPPGPSVNTGTISGKVRQYDKDGMQYLTGLNTATVMIAGSTMSTVTDAAGIYALSNVPAGVYDLWFSKPGSGVFKYQQNTFPGNGNLIVNGYVTDRATFTITSGYVKDSVGSVIVRASVPASTKSRYLVVLLGRTPDIDPDNANSFEALLSYLINPSQTTISGSAFHLNQVFGSGTTVYAKIFPSNATGYNTYYDYYSEKSMNATLGTPLSPRFQLIIP